jgi:hypothetical protein
MHLFLRIIFVLAFFIFSFACSSTEVKNGEGKKFPVDGDEVIPRKYKSIYIHNFTNNSYEGELTGEIKDTLFQKFSLQRRFKLTSEKNKSDLWLYGQIEYFKLTPRDIDEFGRVTRYLMTIIVTIWVRPNSAISSEDILDKSNVRFDTFYAPDLPPYENEFGARQRLVEGLSDRIVQTVLTGWYSDLKTNEELGYDPKEKKNIFGY